MRECGLKYHTHGGRELPPGVTPRAGVWIEIISAIEKRRRLGVTPRAGVWIEMEKITLEAQRIDCHSPCGSVD